MKTLELDRDKILGELKRRKKSSAWLARQIGCSRAVLHDNMMKGSTKRVGQIGDVLGITPKLLVKTVTVEELED